MRSPSPAASLPTSVTSASTATASISFGPEHLALLTPVSLLSLGSLAAFHLLQQLALSDPPTHVGFVHAKYHLPLDREGRKNSWVFQTAVFDLHRTNRCCVQEARVPGLRTAVLPQGPAAQRGRGCALLRCPLFLWVPHPHGLPPSPCQLRAAS